MLHCFDITKQGRVFSPFTSRTLHACLHAALFIGALGKSHLKVSGNINAVCFL